MRFRVDQRFTVPRDDVLAAYTDPAFYVQLDGLPKIGRPEVLGSTTDGDRVTMRVHYRFTATLPAAALAVIDPAKLAWVDETVYDLRAGTSTTRLLPDHYEDRFSASATASFDPHPADPTHSLRRIEGELKVRMMLVGSKVEQAIVEGLQEHLADEAMIINQHLAGA